MPFSSRQLLSMQVMGLVPWVERTSLTTPVSAEVTIATKATAITAASEYESPGSVSLNAIEQCLPTLTLRGINYRGAAQSWIGTELAPVLVLIESAENALAADLPFVAAEARMFDEMMRAIDLTRRDLCIGVLAKPSNSNDLSTAVVATGNLPERQVILLFCQTLDVSDDASQHRFEIPGSQATGWRLPHPALMQQQAARKRQAWNVLKAVRATLATA